MNICRIMNASITPSQKLSANARAKMKPKQYRITGSHTKRAYLVIFPMHSSKKIMFDIGSRL